MVIRHESARLLDTNKRRRPPPQKSRMNLSETSSENLPLSTERCVTTRTKRARTAARLDTASTTVPRSRITQRASSAVFAVMQAIWLVIALTDREAQAGVMTALLVLLVALAAETMSIAFTR